MTEEEMIEPMAEETPEDVPKCKVIIRHEISRINETNRTIIQTEEITYPIEGIPVQDVVDEVKNILTNLAEKFDLEMVED